MNMIRLGELVDGVIDRGERKRTTEKLFLGVSTGFLGLDVITDGLEAGDLWLIASRPSMGKSSLCRQIVNHVACVEEKPVAIFGYSESAEMVLQRMVQVSCKIDSTSLRTGLTETEPWRTFKSGLEDFRAAPLYFDSDLSLKELAVTCKGLRSDIPDLTVVIIDDIQSLVHQDKRLRFPPDATMISSALKQIAEESGVAVMAISQVARQADNRNDKRPMIRDLWDWGRLDGFADVVCFLYRESYYKPEPETAHIAELILAKNRKGITGTVELKWNVRCGRFDDYVGLEEQGENN